DSVRAAANVYLDKLAAHLRDFIDLDGRTLDGQGTAWITASRKDGTFKADAAAELKQFAFVDRAGKGIREPSLKLLLAATGKTHESLSLSTAALTLTTDGDEVRVTLLEPIPDLRHSSAGKFDVRFSSDLGQWHRRITAAATLYKDFAMKGKAAGRGIARVGFA